MEVRIDELPTDISPEAAVRTAYSDDIRWIERKLRQGISVLVECDKQLTYALIQILRDALREEHDGRAMGHVIAGANTEPVRRRRRRRTGSAADAQETEEVEDAVQQRGGIGGMVDDMAEAIRRLSDDMVLILPHLDLIATHTRSGLGPTEREVIALLYNNPNVVILAFKDPEFELPESIVRVFPGSRQILGIPRDALRHIVTQREARKLGEEAFDAYALYKYVSGVNAYRFRQIMPLFDDRPDFDPSNTTTRDRIYSDIRELTLAGDLEVPRVDLDRDIGGYEDVKDRIRRDVFDILEARDAAQSPEEIQEFDSVLPRGILLEGPPGTGKTFFAKAIATKIQAAVIVVSGPELKSQWVGASEQNLRNIFIRARKSAPAVIIFDEIDSFARSRAESSQDGGNVDASMVNTLLTEMDGFKNSPDELVFVVGTTNFSTSLDPALLRPGRFSLVINVPAPGKEDRLAILDIYRRKYGLAISDEVLDYLVLKTGGFADPANRRRFSGDDLHAIMARFRRQAILTPPDERKPVSTAQVDAAVAEGTIGGGRSRADSGKVTFDDIGGYEDVKRKIDRDVLSLVRMRDKETDPARLERLAELIPDAILLEGPAGTGKTFLARAIAGTINAGVIVVNASEFKSKWYGESQENLREVFAEARKSAPTIIIFDEIDSFAGARGGSPSGGGYGSKTDDEIVNTLLTEMDGFSPTDQVLVVGTTNFAESLDPAVRRRFDYVLPVPPPNEKDRREILALLARKNGLEIPKNVFDFIVERTSGIVDRAARRRFAGDDLKEIVKTLRRNQALDGDHPVTMGEAEEAIFQRMAGGSPSMGGMAIPEGFRSARKLDDEEKAEEEWATSLHECGHALVAIALKDASWPYKVSIEAPEDAGWAGVTLKEAKEGNLTRAQLLADVASAMGGRVAEEVILGDLTTGAASDLESATHIARIMVETLGMSKLGPVSFGGQDGHGRARVSQRFAERIDEEVQKILSEQEDRAREVVQKYRKELEALAKLLVQRRVLDELDLVAFAREHGWGDRVPKRLRSLTKPQANPRDRGRRHAARGRVDHEAGWRRCPTSRRDRGGRRPK